MKLLFLTSRLPYPPHRGDKLKIYNLIRQLSSDHEITLISFIGDEKEREFVPELERYCKKVVVVYLPVWRSLVNCLFALFSDLPFQVAYFSLEAMRGTVREEIRKGEYDLIHVHLIRMAQYTPSREVSAPRVLDLTDAGSLYLSRFLEIERNPLKKLMLRIEFNRLVRYERTLEDFTVNLVCSEVDRDALLRNAPQANMELLYNGIDLEYFMTSSSRREEPYSMICTGNMSYFPNEDGVQYFVKDIMPGIVAELPAVKLFIVGQNPTSKVMRLQSESVEVTGFVPDIREYYLKCAVAIAPVRFGAGTLNKILEPMALGIPVVTTSVGVEGLPVKNGTDIFVTDSPMEFAQYVVKLFKDESLRKKIGENGQAVVRGRYDWKIIGKRLNEIYTMAVNMRKPVTR